ncbi:MAG TPA: hypothetical protein VGJ26_15405 [Pirellulales bacterium]|jgi:hypothetical protein
MALWNRYSIFPARVGDLLLRQIGSADLRSATNKSEVTPGGAVDRSAVITAYADPMSTFKTPDFGVMTGATFISLLTGYIFDTTAEVATASTLLQLQQRLDGGLFTGAGANILLTSQKGFAAVTDISASQDDPAGAAISIDVWHLSTDGLTIPVVATFSQNLTSTPAYNGFWYLGPIFIGDPAGSPFRLRGVQRVTINPGLQYTVKRADGNPFAAIGSIVRRNPEIRVTLSDPQQLYASGIGGMSLFGKAITAGIRIACYFQAGLHGGQRVDEGTAAHYRFTAQTGDMQVDQVSVQENDDATVDLVVRPTGTLTLAALNIIP